MVYVGTDGKLRGQLRRLASGGTDGIAPITTTSTVNDGQWHHVAVTATSTEQRMYLDGQPVGTLPGAVRQGWSSSATVGSRGVSKPLPVAAQQAGSGADWPATGTAGQPFGFDGVIDEVAIYAKPLTANEVVLHSGARQAVPYKMSKITLPSGRVWMSNIYDPATDRLKTHTDNNGGTWQIGTVDYNTATGLSQVKVTDPGNNTLTATYDAWRGYRIVSQADQLGKITKYEYNTAGYPQAVTDPNGNRTEYAYSERGNMLGRATFRDKTQWPQWEWFAYHENKANPFDPVNDRLHSRLEQRSQSFMDDTYGRHWFYDAYGQVTFETWPTSVGGDWWGISYAYTDGTEAAVGGGTVPKGLLKHKQNNRNSSWDYLYTAAGDLAEETLPSGLKIAYTHDMLGRLASRSEISAANPTGVKTTFTYNALGKKLTETGPGVRNEVTDVTNTVRTSYVYDADGRPLSQTQADLTGGDAPRVTTYTYDPFGRPDTVTGPEGGVVRTSWNSFGNPVTTTDQMGSVFGYTYTKRQEGASRTLKNWTGSPVVPTTAKEIVLETRSYDPAGRLAATTDAMGRKKAYTYFDDNRPSQVIGDDVKLNGSATAKDVVLESSTYDAAGNLTKKVNGGAVAITTENVYDNAGRLTSTTLDPAGLNRKTAYTYDLANNPTKVTRTGGGTSRTESIEYAYNAADQKIRQTVENGDQDLVTTWTIDDRGLVTETTDPRGNADGASPNAFTTTQRYDLAGRLVEVKAPQVQVDKGGTASSVRPTTKAGYDAFGRQTSSVDPEGRTATTTFDKADRPTKVSLPTYTPPGGTAVIPTSTVEYDPAGRPTRSVDPRGFVRTLEYDQLGHQVRITDPVPQGQTPGQWVTEYDLAGEELATVDPTGARIQATYDDLGRKITRTLVERKPASAAYTTTLAYNEAGYLTTQVAPGNKTTTYTVNAAGEVTAKTDPLTHKTTLAYDLAGRLIKTTDALGNATQGDYDLAGRSISATNLNPSGNVLRTVSAGYDPAGNKTSITSAQGHLTRQTFDALNRLTSQIEPTSATESITTTFGYDATGGRTRLTDGRGNATWTSYNSLGLPETVTEPATTAHPGAADRTWTSIYDAAGNQVASVQPGGVRIDRTFDHLGRVASETGSGGGTTSTERTFGYDLAGRATAVGGLSIDYNDRNLPLKITQGGTQQTAYTYDALGNPTQRIDAAGTSAFTWDNANRLLTATDPVTARTLTYGYDTADRLKTITPTSGQAGTQSFDYDDLSRITGHTLKNGSGTQLAQLTYGWDNDGNLTTKTTAGTAGAGTNTYTYDHTNRLTSWTAPGGTTTAYEWDASGNRTKAGNQTYTYDERNRLTSGGGADYTYTPRGTLATEAKSGATTAMTFDAFDRLIADGESLYTYDALNRVTSRSRGTAKQTYAYTGLANDIAASTDSGTGTILAKYSRDVTGGLLGMKEGAGAAVAALSDLHSDLVATFNATALMNSSAYDPFGGVTAQTGGATTLGYQGEYTDPDTGKVNMHARWYQPRTSTFTGRDTATLKPSPSVQANRYTYANASPITGTDTTGHWTEVPGSGQQPGSNSGGITLPSRPDPSSGHSVGGNAGYLSQWIGSFNNVISNGGGCVGSGNICRETFAHQRWWMEYMQTPDYILAQPEFDPEEAARVGVVDYGMGVGRPAPDGYWSSDKDRRKIFADLYDPNQTQESLNAAWKALTRKPTSDGWFGWANGWQVRQIESGNDSFYYQFRYRIGFRPDVYPSEAATWVKNNIQKVFPFEGCPPRLSMGTTCTLDLQAWTKGPVKVIAMDPWSWTFVALDGHVDPTGATIRFEFSRGNATKPGAPGDFLWLTVTAQGPKEGLHHWSIEWFANLLAHDSWAVLARNIAQWMPYDL